MHQNLYFRYPVSMLNGFSILFLGLNLYRIGLIMRLETRLMICWTYGYCSYVDIPLTGLALGIPASKGITLTTSLTIYPALLVSYNKHKSAS